MKTLALYGNEINLLLDGRATILRSITPQPEKVGDALKFNGQIFIHPADCASYIFHEHYGMHGTPYGSVYPGGGDKVAITEFWNAKADTGQWWSEVKTGHELYNWAWTNPVRPAYAKNPPEWLRPETMPAAAVRIIAQLEEISVYANNGWYWQIELVRL